MSEGFSELRAPVYSKTLVDERGQPLLLGYAPVLWDRDCPTQMRFRIPVVEGPPMFASAGIDDNVACYPVVEVAPEVVGGGCVEPPQAGSEMAVSRSE